MGLMEGERGDERLSSTIITGSCSSPSSSMTAGGSASRGQAGSGPSRMRQLLSVGGLRSLVAPRSPLNGPEGAGDSADGPPAWEQSLQLGQIGGPVLPGADAARASHSFSDHSLPSREASDTSTSTAHHPSGPNTTGRIGSGTSGVAPAGNSLTGSLGGASYGSGGGGGPAATTGGLARGAGGRGISSFDGNGMGGPGSSSTGGAGLPISRGGSLGSSVPDHHSMLVRPPIMANSSYASHGSGGRRSSNRTSQSRFFSMLLGPSGGGGSNAQDARLFYGLRVRMGVASGVLAPGVDIRNSAVFDLAKGARRGAPLGARATQSGARLGWHAGPCSVLAPMQHAHALLPMQHAHAA
jgi:hypothetical protein